ncbi:ROK family transcriptional regulator [Brevibacillus sp. SYP-B805]|uniref:ROK family transcriptional regulator n=1 Tax=Brevibacillus sp. SYP-B805 TaxID=1578199 RepID=UPI0013EBC08A|nr:ROK family transcriptional regulator [Brevibacillus sp. SYP-B805]NGQ96801.1 ROK family transcriptional regulator [Brevibacillus sp. SYP-B805]
MSQELQTGSFQWMKSLNKSTILHVIRRHGPISRAEIAKLTKLTPPTVTNIVNELLESKLVVESELGESSGGRKPILLRLDSSRFTVIGICVGTKRIRGVTATLDGQVVQYVEEGIPAQPSPEEFLARLTSVVRRLITQTDEAVHSILGIGVGMHGLIDPERGVSIYAPHLHLRNVPVKEVLETTFSLPVEVQNDVRALALGESWFGQGQGISNFICVYVGSGVGAGIILEGRLYHGTSYSAGEMGHTTIDIEGPKCHCGNNGCLEAFVSGPAIARRAREAIRSGAVSVLKEWVSGDLEQLTGEMVHRAAQQGDELAIRILEDTGKYLGIGLANLINTLNPSKIILSGGVARAGDFVLRKLRETVQERALQTPAQAVTIVTSELGPHAMEIGAVTLFLQKMFTPGKAAEIS